jgi:hypothetical protein
MDLNSINGLDATSIWNYDKVYQSKNKTLLFKTPNKIKINWKFNDRIYYELRQLVSIYNWFNKINLWIKQILVIIFKNKNKNIWIICKYN